MVYSVTSYKEFAEILISNCHMLLRHTHVYFADAHVTLPASILVSQISSITVCDLLYRMLTKSD